MATYNSRNDVAINGPAQDYTSQVAQLIKKHFPHLINTVRNKIHAPRESTTWGLDENSIFYQAFLNTPMSIFPGIKIHPEEFASALIQWNEDDVFEILEKSVKKLDSFPIDHFLLKSMSGWMTEKTFAAPFPFKLEPNVESDLEPIFNPGEFDSQFPDFATYIDFYQVTEQEMEIDLEISESVSLCQDIESVYKTVFKKILRQLDRMQVVVTAEEYLFALTKAILPHVDDVFVNGIQISANRWKDAGSFQTRGICSIAEKLFKKMFTLNFLHASSENYLGFISFEQFPAIQRLAIYRAAKFISLGNLLPCVEMFSKQGILIYGNVFPTKNEQLEIDHHLTQAGLLMQKRFSTKPVKEMDAPCDYEFISLDHFGEARKLFNKGGIGKGTVKAGKYLFGKILTQEEQAVPLHELENVDTLHHRKLREIFRVLKFLEVNHVQHMFEDYFEALRGDYLGEKIIVEGGARARRRLNAERIQRTKKGKKFCFMRKLFSKVL